MRWTPEKKQKLPKVHSRKNRQSELSYICKDDWIHSLKYPMKKVPGPYCFTREIFKFKEEITAILYQMKYELLKKKEKGRERGG